VKSDLRLKPLSVSHK